MKLAPLYAAVLLSVAGAVHGEQLFVIDKLVLNVYEEANQDSARVATIETGDAVESIERVDNFVRVRLADGREGWVGASYLTQQPPAILRLRELQNTPPASGENASEAEAQLKASQKKLTDEVARLQKENAGLRSEVTNLQQQIATQSEQAAAVEPTDSTVEASEEEAAEDTPPQPAAPADGQSWRPIALWLLLSAFAGIAGFALGYRALDRRIRQKFAGVRIYQ